MVGSLSTLKRFRFAALPSLIFIGVGCASTSPSADRADDPNRSLAAAALAILSPKTEISFPPLPFARRTHALHRGSPIAGYELVFADRSAVDERPSPGQGSCRITCIGGDCALGPNSEAQLFLVQGKFVVSYSRMLGKSNRIVAFLASLKRSFEAPVVYLDCTLTPHDSHAATADDLLAQLPSGTTIDAVKNAPLSLTESLPGTAPTYEIATNKCLRRASNPYSKAALFVLTAKGIVSYDVAGRPLPYRIGCGNRGGVSRCTKIVDYLKSNGVNGCLF